MPAYRVLVIGGYGFFGSRLVRRLALQHGLLVMVAGRDASKAGALARDVPRVPGTEVQGIELNVHGPELNDWLRASRADVVIHAVGPFQQQGYEVARACIEVGCHYIDLADGREFVCGIGVLDGEARAAGVLVVSGASSVPALSSAAADHLAKDLDEVTDIDIGISPGNRTDRGLATVQAILSYVGKPLPGGAAGWGAVTSRRYPPPVGRRLLSACDVPDLALLGPRYPGTPRVRFAAGLELKWMHLGLWLGSVLVRAGLVRSLDPHARLLKRVADFAKDLGSDAGAMHVSLHGRSRQGQSVARTWMLLATHGDGPYVPTLAAAALVRKLASGAPLPRGAQPCIGLLTLDDFVRECAGLAIGFDAPGAPSLMQRALGDDYDRMPEPLARFHSAAGRHEMQGEVQARGPRNLPGRLLARLLGVPLRDVQGPLRFELEAGALTERWTRHFPGRSFTSTFTLDSLHEGSQLSETMGPARLSFRLQASEAGLSLELERFAFLGVPLPRFFWPRLSAKEWSEPGSGAARLSFDVQAAVSGIGVVAHYRGHVDLLRELRS